MSIYSTNAKINGDKNYRFTILPTVSLTEQLEKQIDGLNNCSSDDTLVLHPSPAVGSASCAFLRGKNNAFPTIALVVPYAVSHRTLSLHPMRHELVRPYRAQFLLDDDEIHEDALIVVNASGREISEYQETELMQLTKNRFLVEARLQLGQVDLSKQDLANDLLEHLLTGLKQAGVGKSITGRRVVMIPAGLSPVNAILATMLNGLCESWCSIAVAVCDSGIFHYKELVYLQDFENMGRNAIGVDAPVQISQELYDKLLKYFPEDSELGKDLKSYKME